MRWGGCDRLIPLPTSGAQRAIGLHPAVYVVPTRPELELRDFLCSIVSAAGELAELGRELCSSSRRERANNPAGPRSIFPDGFQGVQELGAGYSVIHGVETGSLPYFSPCAWDDLRARDDPRPYKNS